MAKRNESYSYVIVESYRSGLHGPIHIRPIEGQPIFVLQMDSSGSRITKKFKPKDFANSGRARCWISRSPRPISPPSDIKAYTAVCRSCEARICPRGWAHWRAHKRSDVLSSSYRRYDTAHNHQSCSLLQWLEFLDFMNRVVAQKRWTRSMSSSTISTRTSRRMTAG